MWDFGAEIVKLVLEYQLAVDGVPVMIESMAMELVLVRMGLKDLVVNFAEIQANLEAIAIKLVRVSMVNVKVECMAQDTVNQTAVT